MKGNTGQLAGYLQMPIVLNILSVSIQYAWDTGYRTHSRCLALLGSCERCTCTRLQVPSLDQLADSRALEGYDGLDHVV